MMATSESKDEKNDNHKENEAQNGNKSLELSANMIIQIDGLKKQKQHNKKFGIIVDHKLNSTTNRFRVRLLEDDEFKKKSSDSFQIYHSFGLANESTPSEPSPFKHLYIKDANLHPMARIAPSKIHKEGIFALRSYKSGDVLWTDIPLLECDGVQQLWRSDAANQVTRIWDKYCKCHKVKKTCFDALHYSTESEVYLDVAKAINRLSTEPTFKMRYDPKLKSSIPDEVMDKMKKHFPKSPGIDVMNEECGYEFLKWCRVITTFKMNTLHDTVWVMASKLNHCCRPNVYLNPEGVVTALCDIEEGDELLVSYLVRDTSLYKYQQLRSIEIQRTKGFRCQCPRCFASNPSDGIYDDARNFRCQFCSFGMVSWNGRSSRFFTKCNDVKCGKFPMMVHQAQFHRAEKRLSVFLQEHTGDIEVSALRMKPRIPDPEEEKEGAMAKLSEDLKGMLNEGRQYMKQHYLLIALFHRLCQVNLHIDWLRLRYRTMCEIYPLPNDCLLRATAEYHRFLPLLTVGQMMSGKIKKEKNKQIVDRNQDEIDRVQLHIETIKSALGME